MNSAVAAASSLADRVAKTLNLVADGLVGQALCPASIAFAPPRDVVEAVGEILLHTHQPRARGHGGGDAVDPLVLGRHCGKGVAEDDAPVVVDDVEHAGAPWLREQLGIADGDLVDSSYEALVRAAT